VISIANQLNVTFGSKDLLTQYISSYPERSFKLLQSNNDPDDLQYQLIDVSNEPSIFKYGKSFSIIESSGSDELRGLFHFTFFKLNNDQIKSFVALTKLKIFNNSEKPFLRALLLQDNNNINEYILLTLWATNRELDHWRDSRSYQVIFSSLVNPITPSYSNVYYPTT